MRGSDVQFQLFEILDSWSKASGNSGELKLVKLRKNTMLFNEGDIPKGVFYLKQGIVKVVREEKNGKRPVMRVAESHDFLGYVSLIKHSDYTASAMAIIPGEAVFIPKDIFEKALQESTEFAQGVIELLTERVAESDKHIEDLTVLTVKQRLAGTLLLLDHAFKFMNPEYDDRIKVMRKDLADISGTIPETLSRQLAILEKEGLIELVNRHIEIRNRDQLLEMSQLHD